MTFRKTLLKILKLDLKLQFLNWIENCPKETIGLIKDKLEVFFNKIKK